MHDLSDDIRQVKSDLSAGNISPAAILLAQKYAGDANMPKIQVTPGHNTTDDAERRGSKESIMSQEGTLMHVCQSAIWMPTAIVLR